MGVQREILALRKGVPGNAMLAIRQASVKSCSQYTFKISGPSTFTGYKSEAQCAGELPSYPLSHSILGVYLEGHMYQLST
jgi:hypothetical protein